MDRMEPGVPGVGACVGEFSGDAPMSPELMFSLRCAGLLFGLGAIL